MQAVKPWNAVALRPLALHGRYRSFGRGPESCHTSLTIETCKYGLEPRRHATTPGRPRRLNLGRHRHVEETSSSPILHYDHEIIDPKSLEKTLHAHRKANKRSIKIIKIRNDVPEGSPVPKSSAKSFDTLHLALDRGAEQVVQRKDYEGKSRQLSLEWELVGNISRYLRNPWMKELDKQGPSYDFAIDRLKKEIQAMDTFLSPDLKEWNAAEQAIKSLEEAIFRLSPATSQIDVVGSRGSGLATALSDIDLNVSFEKSTFQKSTWLANQLWYLFQGLKYRNSKDTPLEATYFATGARVPIISGIHNPTHLEFQIQSTDNSFGSLEMVRQLLAELPAVRPLFKVIKHMLKIRGLGDGGTTGGLTSYPLINMIAVSLKLNAAKTSPNDHGTQLSQFLEFWSTIDLYKSGITHVPSKYLQKRSDGHFSTEEITNETISLVLQDPVGATPIIFDVRKPIADLHRGTNDFAMVLHDPADPYNDLGRNIKMIKHIQATFMDIRTKLKADMSEWDRSMRANAKSSEEPPSLLRSLIEGDYSMYNIERRRLTAEHNEQNK